jgi:hypothetical protein
MEKVVERVLFSFALVSMLLEAEGQSMTAKVDIGKNSCIRRCSNPCLSPYIDDEEPVQPNIRRDNGNSLLAEGRDGVADYLLGL